MMARQNIIKLAVSLILPQLAGAIGSIFTVSAIPVWYATLNKPTFTPPSWLFAPAWTTLYLLMGIAFYFVWREGLEKRAVRTAFWIFIVQLILNALWSLLFFGLKSPLYGFLGIIELWLLIALTIFLFWRVRKLAAYLLIPYILWVTFASALNYAILILN